MKELLSIVVFVVYMVLVVSAARAGQRSALGWAVICLLLPGLGPAWLAYLISKQAVACPKCGNGFPMKGQVIRDDPWQPTGIGNVGR